MKNNEIGMNLKLKNMENTRSFGKGTGVLVTIVFLLFYNILFGQWTNPGTNLLSYLDYYPSTFVLNESTIFMVGGNGTYGSAIYRSTNSGANFTALSRPSTSKSKFLSCVFATSQNTIYVGEGGTAGDGLVSNARFFMTTDGGSNWTQLGTSGASTKGFFNGIVFSKSNPQFGVAICDPPSRTSGTFQYWKTTNGGLNWSYASFVSPNSAGAQNSVFVIDENFFGFGLSEANARVAFTTNSGTNWNYSILPGTGAGQGFVTTVTFHSDKLHGFAGVSNNSDSIWQTTNGGVNWTKIPITGIPNSASGQPNLKYIDGTNTAFFVLSNGTTYTYKMHEHGSEIIAYPPTSTVTNIMHIDDFYLPTDAPGDATMFAVTSDGHISRFQDSPLPVQLASFTYGISGRNVNLKWVTTMEQNNSGFEIYRINESADKGVQSNWSKIGFVKGKGNVSGITEYNFSDINLNSGKYNYKLKQIDYNGNYEFFELNGTVSIDTPGKINLGQNYPNPFNPVTNIGFEIPQDAKVTMKVYDISGREIITLVNEYKTAGYHTVKFNASDYSSGIYFYKIRVDAKGGITEYTRAMSVVK
jgi:photosystem II stability/assembly factor-like uncharacterized protein